MSSGIGGRTPSTRSNQVGNSQPSSARDVAHSLLPAPLWFSLQRLHLSFRFQCLPEGAATLTPQCLQIYINSNFFFFKKKNGIKLQSLQISINSKTTKTAPRISVNHFRGDGTIVSVCVTLFCCFLLYFETEASWQHLAVITTQPVLDRLNLVQHLQLTCRRKKVTL